MTKNGRLVTQRIEKQLLAVFIWTTEVEKEDKRKGLISPREERMHASDLLMLAALSERNTSETPHAHSCKRSSNLACRPGTRASRQTLGTNGSQREQKG